VDQGLLSNKGCLIGYFRTSIPPHRKGTWRTISWNGKKTPRFLPFLQSSPARENWFWRFSSLQSHQRIVKTLCYVPYETQLKTLTTRKDSKVNLRNMAGFRRLPLSNFRYSLTLFSKFFSPFPHGTCELSVSGWYLALDEDYHLYSTRDTTLVYSSNIWSNTANTES